MPYHTSRTMIHQMRLIAFLVPVVLLLVGCGPKSPDKSIILWGQPSPMVAALAHQSEKPGLIAFEVAPTGSMEPFATGGDWIVADFKFPYDGLKAADPVLYQAQWLPATSPLVFHMAAAKSGDYWIMDGIANKNYESGVNGIGHMRPQDYRAKVIQVYTKRAKP